MMNLMKMHLGSESSGDQVMSASEYSTINPIDCYRHFITDDIISLEVHKTHWYAVERRSKYREWKPTTDEEMLSEMIIKESEIG